MADLEELVVRIKADASQLTAQMAQANNAVRSNVNQMSSSLGGLANQFKALLPALSVSAFVAFGASAWNAADRLNDLSQRTGIAASTLSALNIPLKQGGSNVDEFAASINRMNNIIGEAAKGQNVELIATFDKLGLSITKLRNLSPERQFYTISEALNRIKNQADFTNTGIAIFGRSFSTLAPLIRDADGNLAKFVETAKKTGAALSEEELARIDKFGDAWTNALGRIEISLIKVLDGFGMLADIPDMKAKFLTGNPQTQEDVDFKSAFKNAGSREEKNRLLRERVQGRQLKQEDDFLADDELDSILGVSNKGGAKGSNADILAAKKAAEDAISASKRAESERRQATKSLKEYNQELARQHEIQAMTPQQQAGMEAYYKTLDIAQKAGIKNASELALKNQQVAESNYKISEAQQEAARTAQEMRDKMSDALTSAILDFKSASDAAKSFARSIASAIIQKSITGPLSQAVVGNGSSGSGLLSGLTSGLSKVFSGSLPSFDVGSDNIPSDMIANIHKGEMIIPAVQADAIRRGNGVGGNNVVINQTFNAYGNDPELIKAHVRSLAPQIAKAAHDSVFASMQRGGTQSKIAGVR